MRSFGTATGGSYPPTAPSPLTPFLRDDFTHETKRTRAPWEVRAIYHERFSAYRGSWRGDSRRLVALMVIVIIVAVAIAQTC